jgi:hypothetical protein
MDERLSFPEIAAELHQDPAIVRDAFDLFQAFPTKAAMEKLLARRRKDGMPLAYSTLAVLCRQWHKARRVELLRRVLAENLSKDELKALLRAEAGPGRERADSGCTPEAPPSPSTGSETREGEARKCASDIPAVLDEPFVAELVRRVPDSDVAVAIEEFEQTLTGTINALRRELAAALRLKAAVAARHAGPAPGRTSG